MKKYTMDMWGQIGMEFKAFRIDEMKFRNEVDCVYFILCGEHDIREVKQIFVDSYDSEEGDYYCQSLNGDHNWAIGIIEFEFLMDCSHIKETV